MKTIIGAGMILVGIVLGLYVGVWVLFIGGIIDVIEQIKADELQAMAVAIGVAKVIFAGLGGWLSAILLIIPGMVIVGE
jgi:hypothetical protein